MDRRIEKDTLALVPLGPKYEQFYIEMVNNPAIRAEMNDQSPYQKEHFNELLERGNGNKNMYRWIIEENGEPVGAVAFYALKSSSHIFQGLYWLSPTAWGRGLATRALGMAADFLFLSAGAVRLQALVKPGNVPSMRVLEKCGFRNEGLLRSYLPQKSGKLLDVHMYALTLAG